MYTDTRHWNDDGTLAMHRDFDGPAATAPIPSNYAYAYDDLGFLLENNFISTKNTLFAIVAEADAAKENLP